MISLYVRVFFACSSSNTNAASDYIILDLSQLPSRHILLHRATVQLARLSLINLPQHPSVTGIQPARVHFPVTSADEKHMQATPLTILSTRLSSELSFAGWILPLWQYVYNRSDPTIRLCLTNVVLHIPQQEIDTVLSAYTLGLNLVASAASPVQARALVAAAAALSPQTAGPGASASSHPSPDRQRLLQSLTSETMSVAASLLGWAMSSKLESGGLSASLDKPTMVTFSRLSFGGWSGVNVTLSSQMPQRLSTSRAMPFNISTTQAGLSECCVNYVFLCKTCKHTLMGVCASSMCMCSPGN